VLEVKKPEKTAEMILEEEETNVHPELARKQLFSKLKPMQPVTDVNDIVEILSKSNARMFVDLHAKEFSFAKVKRSLGNIIKVRALSTMETIVELIDQHLQD
jgi:hypothetical protein